eukprot:Phypoly_transcript_02459.p2 GENE.Phypoly_transcript_02459~~Phypoly_transcript_02459.p2  ORF type:complete len:261 (+),score=25.98 Phypoly_transcript_02459:1540-2322(+)
MDEELTNVLVNRNNNSKSKLFVGSDLRRSNSSPIASSSLSTSDVVLVKVTFPSLDCSKIFRLNPKCVNYEPLVKILIIAKVDEEEQREFRLFTAKGHVINPGDPLLECHFKEKDTLMFKHTEHTKSTRRYTDGAKRNTNHNERNNLSSSTGDLRPPTTPLPNGTSPVASSDYWGSVSTFIGSFLKRRPTVTELPRHVLEMMDTPLVPRSNVIVACLSYLREKEAYSLEGIFRLSGLATEVQAVCESFKHGMEAPKFNNKN